MGRYPELAIRIDVEHEIVNPVAENYDIVFAMLEAPLPSAGTIIRRCLLYRTGIVRRSRAGGTVWRTMLVGGPCKAAAADRACRCAMGDHDAAGHAGTSCGRKGEADQFQRPYQAAGGACRAWCETCTLPPVSPAPRSRPGLLRRLLPDHVCEPLNVHALLPARQFIPAKVRCFLYVLGGPCP